MFKHEFPRSDGRTLYLYSSEPQRPQEFGTALKAPTPQSHMRWHVLREEWVVYSSHRQDRTFLPQTDKCPLCPTSAKEQESEVPFRDFEIAVFENRFPSFNARAIDAPQSPVMSGAAKGVCEVVVFSPEHVGSLRTLSDARRELLVKVWADRYQELYKKDFIAYVLPFENRGIEVGVTLHHPHGQVYGYSFVPPIVERECKAFEKENVIEKLFAESGPEYTVCEDDNIRAIVPPCARYPYEVWIAPKRFHPGPWTFNESETKSFAKILGQVVACYDKLFNKPFPYNMVLHAAPKGFEARYHFHVEFYPPLRTAEKLKYVAAAELGAGNFLVDALPEVTAAKLREAANVS